MNPAMKRVYEKCRLSARRGCPRRSSGATAAGTTPIFTACWQRNGPGIVSRLSVMHRGPVRGRGRGQRIRGFTRRVPGASCRWLLTAAPFGAEDDGKNFGVSRDGFQGQVAPGYSPRPRSGPRTRAKNSGFHATGSRGKLPLAIHRGPVRGRGRGQRFRGFTRRVPGASCPWLFTAAPFGTEDEGKEFGVSRDGFQGQVAPGYSPRPRLGPRTRAKISGFHATGSRGKLPLAIHRGPVRGRGRGQKFRGFTRRVPGATSRWLLTAAPFGAEDEGKNFGVSRDGFQGQVAPGYSPRPRSGPRTRAKNSGFHATGSRGKLPLAIYRGPVRGRHGPRP